MRRWLAYAFASLLGIAGVMGAATWFGWTRLHEPLNVSAEGLRIEIEPGTSLSRLARELHSEGVLEHPALLRWYGRLSGAATRIQAGEYAISPDLTPLGLLDKLSAGDVYLHQFTLVEGRTFAEFLAELRARPAVHAGTETPDEIMQLLGLEDVHPEGQFLPDTYVFPKGTRDVEILRWAHEALATELERAWAERAESLAIDSAYEALVLASIIEKETALPSERPVISGVFHERLRRGMRLQTDPTVIYGLGEKFDGNLRRRDLAADTPYNTYTRHGLPPTPIALPGRASIRAAVEPAATDALYFVATGEPDGSHYFSATLEEHNRAVSRYLSRLRENRE